MCGLGRGLVSSGILPIVVVVLFLFPPAPMGNEATPTPAGEPSNVTMSTRSSHANGPPVVTPSASGPGIVKWTLCLWDNKLLSGNGGAGGCWSALESSSVAWDSANGYLYVPNSQFNNVSVISGSTNHVVAAIQMGGYPDAAAYDSGNGDIYVTNRNTNDVSVISASTNTVVATIPVGPFPYGAGYDSGNGDVYITNRNSSNVSVIDGSTNHVVATIHVGGAPFGIGYDSGNGDVYVANMGSGNVSAIDGSTNRVVATVPVGSFPTGAGYDSGNGDIYVTNSQSSNVSVISGSTNTVVANIPVGAAPSGAAYDSGNGDVYVTNAGSNNVSVISGNTNTVVANFPVGLYPMGATYDSGNGNVYVANYQSGSISIITVPPAYWIRFNESGLATRTSWSVTLNGLLRSSTNSTLNFSEINGAYPFSVGPVPGYSTSPASGSVTVNGTNMSQAILFSISVVSVPVGLGPVGVAYDNSNGYVYVANGGSNNVSILSGTNVIATVPAYNAPWGLVYDSQDGYVYAANWGGGSGTWVVTVISGTHDVANITYTTGGTMAPMGITYDSANGTVWVANDAGNGIGVTVLQGLKIVWNLTNPSASSGIGYDPTHNYVYTSYRSTGWAGVMDAAGTFNSFSTGSFSQPYWDTYDPFRHQVYISEYGGNDLLTLNGTKITGNITSVYSPMGVAVDNSSGLLFVTQYGRADVNVVDGTQSLVNISVGTNPIDAVYNPSNGYVYVTNRGSNNVSIINAAGSVSAVLSSVNVSPPSATLSPNSTQSVIATPSCSGGPCASGTTYSWSLTNPSKGSLNATTGNPVIFTAGSTPGTVTLFVNATLNGTKVRSSPVPITITQGSALHYAVGFRISPGSCSPIAFNGSAAYNGVVGSYLAGQYTAVAQPCNNYSFRQWNSTGSVSVLRNTSASTLVNVTGNGSLTAWYVWSGKVLGRGVVSFVVSPASCGPLTFGGINKNNGSSGSFTVGNYTAYAPKCPGYQFPPSWTVTGALKLPTLLGDPTTVWVKGNGTLTATYAPIPPPTFHTIWFQVSPTACSPVSFNGTPQASQSSAQFQSGVYTMHALPCWGYAFSNATFAWAGGVRSQTLPTAWGNVTVSTNGTLWVNYTAYVSTLTASLTTNSSTIRAGSSVQLTASISGGLSPYQCTWNLNGTNNTWTTCGVETLKLSHPGNYTYRVWVRDSYPTLRESPPLAVQVTPPGGSNGPPPLIVTLTANTSVIHAGGSVSLTLSWTQGDCPCHLSAWSLNGTNDSSLSTTTPLSLSLPHAANYSFLGWVVEANGEFGVSSVVLVEVLPLPPRGSSVPPASTPTFLGLPGYDGYFLLIVVAVVVAVVFALTRRKKAEASPSIRYPGYPQQPPYPPGP